MRLRTEESLVRMFMSWPRGYGRQEDASEFIQHFVKWTDSTLFANAWEKRFAHGYDFAQTMVIEKGDNHCSIPKTSDMLPGFDQSATLTQMLNKWYESDNMISALVSNSVIVCFDQGLSHLALRHQSISWQLNVFKCPANIYKFGKLTDGASMAAHAPEAPSLKCELQGCICFQTGHGMQRHIWSTC